MVLPNRDSINLNFPKTIIISTIFYNMLAEIVADLLHRKSDPGGINISTGKVQKLISTCPLRKWSVKQMPVCLMGECSTWGYEIFFFENFSIEKFIWNRSCFHFIRSKVAPRDAKCTSPWKKGTWSCLKCRLMT